MNRIPMLAVALAATLAFSTPSSALTLSEAYDEVGGYYVGSDGLPTLTIAGTREQVDNVFAGNEPTNVGMPVQPGAVLSCPWPTTSRWFPGYMKNVNPVTCQTESLVHDDGGDAIYNRVVTTVNTIRTIVKEMYHDPEAPFTEGWSVTTVSDTTVDAP